MPAARHGVRLLAVALIAVAAVAVAGGGPAAADRTAADARRDDRALAGREQAALSQLYATETALARAQAATAAASARVDRLSREADALRGEVREARRGLGAARRNLAERLTAIYKADRIDPIAVLVTSASLQQALDTADALQRVAQGDETVVEQMTAARNRLSGSLARLRRTQAAAQSERRALADGEAALAASHAAKQSLLGALRRQRHGLGREIAHLDTLAREAAQRSRRLEQSATASAPADAPSPTPSGASPPPSSGGGPSGTLVVDTVAYGLPGVTASGLPVGHGVCAVDPSVIPMGTRFHVPGYGDCIAADVGTAIIGNIIDLWMPTPQAMQWGRRTVTITFL